MFAVSLAFLTAIALAGVAAWFSITGLIAIFAALPLSIAIMAGVLEVAKLVTASVLYRNWSTLPFTIKSYLTTAVIVLMFITSLGIFGYLSKAHIEQGAPIGDNHAKIERLEQRIEKERRVISDAESEIEQLDGAVRVLIEYDKISGPDGSRAVREGQQPKRDELATTIQTSETRIDEYLDEKAELATEIRAFETEIGPIKYIAALAYDEPEAHYEEAVRYIILLLIFVFDPLAVLLLIAANHIQMQLKPKDDGSDTPDEPTPSVDSVDEEEDELFDALTEAIEANPTASPQLKSLIRNRPVWDAMGQAAQYQAQSEDPSVKIEDEPDIVKKEDVAELLNSTIPPIPKIFNDIETDSELLDALENADEYPLFEVGEDFYFTKTEEEPVETAIKDLGYSSFAALSIEDDETLERLIDKLNDTAENRQLTPTEYGWRSSAHNILERRRRNNPILDARINDE